MKKKLLFVLLLMFLTTGLKPWKLFAQADAGYAKVGNAGNSLTFVDSPVTNGSTYQYEITAFNGLDSTPLRTNVVTIPATGTHTVTIAYGSSSTTGVTYNIWRTSITAPNPPVAPASATVN